MSEIDKIQYDALYEDYHKIDDLLETHANIMILLVSGILAFLFTLKSIVAISAVSIVGFFVSLEFFLHTYRFKCIAIAAKNRIRAIEDRYGIDTLRPDTYLLRMKAPTGSTLLCCISLTFMLLWVLLLVLFNLHMISLPT